MQYTKASYHSDNKLTKEKITFQQLIMPPTLMLNIFHIK